MKTLKYFLLSFLFVSGAVFAQEQDQEELVKGEAREEEQA